MTTRFVTRHESPLEAHRLTATLAGFRKKLEKESDEPLSRLELNVTMLLDDLCRFAGLTPEQRERVLGSSATDVAHLLE